MKGIFFLCIIMFFVPLTINAEESAPSMAISDIDSYSTAAAHHKVVIIVHGALMEPEDVWYTAEGDFYRAVAECARELDYAEVIPFTWKQPLKGLTHAEIVLAAEQLAQKIINLTKQGTSYIVLICHSYGGHVAKVASQLLDHAAKELIINSEKKHTPHVEDFFTYKDSYVRVQGDLRISRLPEKDYLIDCVYTLGSPNVNSYDYSPDMNIIGKLFNLFSEGDMIQDFIAEKTISGGERKINLKVQILGPTGNIINPAHQEMHNPCIGQYLLKIPKIFNRTRSDGFAADQIGIVFFDQLGSAPIYRLYNAPIQESYCCTCKPCPGKCVIS